MSIFCADGAPKVYRITGPQSIERLEPLVARLDGSWRAFEQATSNARIDLVWETTCEKTMKHYHDTAIVFNKLHNCQIIESKSNLAYLQRRMKRPTLTTFIALGVKGVEVDLWYAFFAPSKMPAPTVAKLNTEIAAIIRSPEVKDMLGRAGMDATASGVEELAGIVQKDYPRWGAVIKRNGLSAE
jgi:hypothetical protein